jgi:hypothetical protein
LLDIYDIYQQKQPFGLDEVVKEVWRGHDNVEAAFEGSITEELGKLFEPEENK